MNGLIGWAVYFLCEIKALPYKKKVIHTFNQSGNYTIKLTITDDNGASSNLTTYAIINEKINNPADLKDKNNSPLITNPLIYIIIIIIVIGIIIKLKLPRKD